MNSPSRARSAFTLVELLVVLLITTLLIGSATAILRSVASARQVVENRLQGEQAAMAALRTITSQLRNAYRPVTDDDVAIEGLVEQSEPYSIGRIRFLAVDRRIIRQGKPESDVHEIEYFLRDSDQPGHKTLMRRTDPARKNQSAGAIGAGSAGGVLEPLANDIVALDIQYFDAGVWQDNWPGKMKRWPQAISVTLSYRADESTGRVGTVSKMINLPYWSASPGGGT